METSKPLFEEYKLSLSAIHLARHLVIHRSTGTLGLTRRMFEQFDYPLLLVHLVESAPWRRVNPSTGLQEKFDDNAWTPTSKRLSVTEGNVWLSVLSLPMSDEVRSGEYDVSRAHRLAAFLKLRKHLTVAVTDQIPQLRDLSRFLEELNLSNQLGGSAITCPSLKANTSMIAPFAIVDMEESLFNQLKNEEFKLEVIRGREAFMEICGQLAEAYESMDLESACEPVNQDIEVLHSGNRERVCKVCQLVGAENMCGGCKTVVYCSRECQSQDWLTHKPSCTWTP